MRRSASMIEIIKLSLANWILYIYRNNHVTVNSTGHRWIPIPETSNAESVSIYWHHLTKDQWCGKRFHVMTPSWLSLCSCIRMSVPVFVYTYGCTCVRLYGCLYLCSFIRMAVPVFVYTDDCTCVRLYGWLYLCSCIRMTVPVFDYTDDCACVRLYGWLYLCSCIRMTVPVFDYTDDCACVRLYGWLYMCSFIRVTVPVFVYTVVVIPLNTRGIPLQSFVLEPISRQMFQEGKQRQSPAVPHNPHVLLQDFDVM